MLIWMLPWSFAGISLLVHELHDRRARTSGVLIRAIADGFEHAAWQRPPVTRDCRRDMGLHASECCLAEAAGDMELRLPRNFCGADVVLMLLSLDVRRSTGWAARRSSPGHT